MGNIAGKFLAWVFTTPAVGAALASLGCARQLSGENSGPQTAQAPSATVPEIPWPSCLTDALRLASDSATLPGSSCAAPEWLLEEPIDFGVGEGGVTLDVYQRCVKGTLSQPCESSRSDARDMLFASAFRREVGHVHEKRRHLASENDTACE